MMLINNHQHHHQLPQQIYTKLFTIPPPTIWNQLHHQSSSAPLWLIAALILTPLTKIPHSVASQQNNGQLIFWQFNATSIKDNSNLTICLNARPYLNPMLNQLTTWLPQLHHLHQHHMNCCPLFNLQMVIDSFHLAQHAVNQHNKKLNNLLTVLDTMSTQLNSLIFGCQVADLTPWSSTQFMQPCLHSPTPACKLSGFIIGHPTPQFCSYQYLPATNTNYCHYAYLPWPVDQFSRHDRAINHLLANNFCPL